MKHKFILGLILSSFMLTSCGGGSKENSTPTPTPDNEKEDDKTKKEFEGISLKDVKVTYDSKDHIDDINILGNLPLNTKVIKEVTNSLGKVVTSCIEVGVYSFKITLENDDYNSITLTAILTIEKDNSSSDEGNKGDDTSGNKEFNSLTYKDQIVTYDGLDHIDDVKLVGMYPSEAKITTSVKDSKGNTVTSCIEVGTYTFKATITSNGYQSKTYEAKLKINKDSTAMAVNCLNDGSIYFANGLDNNHLYSYSSNSIKKVGSSTPRIFDKIEDTVSTFISNSPLSSGIKQIVNGALKVIYSNVSICDFTKESATIYYFSVNLLTNNTSGIYKVDLTNTSTSEPVVSKIFTGKTKHLTYYKNYLYFTNKNDNSYVYRLNTSTKKSELVLSEKVHEFTFNGNNLYCAVNGLLNDYIGYINLNSSSTTPIVLTDNAGEYLKVKNGYLYYHYTDWYKYIDSSKKGIYRINLSNKSQSLIAPSITVNGYDIDNNGNIYYIDSNNLHLFKYVISNNYGSDLLLGFKATESTPLNLGGRTLKYNNKIYFLNMYEDKTLYEYDETTKTSRQLTDNKVDDFYIINDYLYYNQVTWGVNNDLYRVNLKTMSDITKISTNDVRKMYSDGNYLYGIHYNFAGAAAGICRMNMDGSNYIKFSDINGAKNLFIKNNNLYYINCSTSQDNGDLEYISLSNINSSSSNLKGTTLHKDIKNVKQFIFDGNDLYYIYNGTIENSIRKTSLSNLDKTYKIASSKTNPNEFIIDGNNIYYYSYPMSNVKYAGIYKINKNSTSDQGGELSNRILDYESKYYAGDFTISNNKLYFLNYIEKLLLGDAHEYYLDLLSKKVSKIA